MHWSMRSSAALAAALALGACEATDTGITQPRFTPTVARDASAASCAPAPAGLVAWYSGDNGGLDQAGSHDATLSSNVGTAPGMVGLAFAFNGSPGSRITVPASSAIGVGNAPRTYMMWVYTNADSWALDRHTVFNSGSPGTNKAFALDMDNYPNMQFYLYGPGAYFSPGIPSTRTGWAHVAFTFDGLTTRIYANGSQVASITGAINTTDVPLYIGNAWAGVDDPFTGLIDEFMIFDRALSASEIQGAYGASSAGTGTCSLAPTVSLPAGLSAGEGQAVTVAASVSDANPGDHTFAWDINGDGITDSTNTTGSVSLTFAHTGSYPVQVTVTNSQHRTATASTSITVNDITPPAITFTGNAGQYSVDQEVTISCTAADESGIASSTCAAWDAPAYTYTVGGAVNTLSATAVDGAGNTGEASASFTVSVSDASLCTLAHRFVSNAGVANSFCAKLAARSYGAFRNEVSAQSGKKVSAANAAVLLRLVNVLQGQ